MSGSRKALIGGVAMATIAQSSAGRKASERNPTTRLGLVMAAVAILTPLAFWLNLPWARVAAQLPGVGV